MNKKYERFGLGLEITGLIFLLIATLWESEFSGWWDKSADEWQYQIQEKTNLAALHAIADILSITAIDDPSAVKQAASAASAKARDAAFEIIEMRQSRSQALEGQAKDFSQIRLLLLCAGAAFILLGKMVFLAGYKGP